MKTYTFTAYSSSYVIVNSTHGLSEEFAVPQEGGFLTLRRPNGEGVKILLHHIEDQSIWTAGVGPLHDVKQDSLPDWPRDWEITVTGPGPDQAGYSPVLTISDVDRDAVLTLDFWPTWSEKDAVDE